jgi:hypothetical protein
VQGSEPAKENIDPQNKSDSFPYVTRCDGAFLGANALDKMKAGDTSG